MNITELYELSEWYDMYYKNLHELYVRLHQVISSNSQQPAQQPIAEQLNLLLDFLPNMDIGKLSLQQIKVLQDLAVFELIGAEGTAFINKTVRTNSYDPASSEATLRVALQKIGEASNKLNAYTVALKALDLKPKTLDEFEDRIIVRIGFKKEASINNVTDWKESSKDWYDIIRGLAMAAGESPDDTKVVGATSGSIILILSTTLAFTGLLALISKRVAGIAKDVVSVGIALEDLRQKRLLTKVMEAEFKKLEKTTHDDGIVALKKELHEHLGSSVDGEVKNALDSSITKLLSFGEKGGDVDFVAPQGGEALSTGDEGVEKDNALLQEIERVRRLIHEYQDTRQSVKLLEGPRNQGNDL